MISSKARSILQELFLFCIETQPRNSILHRHAVFIRSNSISHRTLLGGLKPNSSVIPFNISNPTRSHLPAEESPTTPKHSEPLSIEKQVQNESEYLSLAIADAGSAICNLNETSCGGVFRGTWTSLRKIYGNDGMRGLYRGVVPSMWGASLSLGFYLATYDSIKDQMQRHIDNSNGYMQPNDSNDAHKVKSASRLTPARHLVASIVEM
ncbi:hypothetical protein BJ741DRAFT_669427 [Chytriomyces cf. hyalinus JEL632]|nr:hypothetical protein BJ741DRAFT_669427 [Chytriomyces cf. hyalinus JEL632]